MPAKVRVQSGIDQNSPYGGGGGNDNRFPCFSRASPFPTQLHKYGMTPVRGGSRIICGGPRGVGIRRRGAMASTFSLKFLSLYRVPLMDHNELGSLLLLMQLCSSTLVFKHRFVCFEYVLLLLRRVRCQVTTSFGRIGAATVLLGKSMLSLIHESTYLRLRKTQCLVAQDTTHHFSHVSLPPGLLDLH